MQSTPVVRFFECHVLELKKQVHMGDEHIFIQYIKSVQLKETKKVKSQHVRHKEGRLLRSKGRILEILELSSARC